MLTKTAQEGGSFPSEHGGRCQTELADRFVALARPGEEEPEMEPDALAVREPVDERAEPGERRGQVVLVEAADCSCDLRLVVAGMATRRPRVHPLRRMLVALALQQHSLRQLRVRPGLLEDRV